MADRSATAKWTGGLFDGKGTVNLDSSGLGEYEVSWPRRAEEPDGSTSPEELLAAAHASCFNMALSKAVADAGGTNASFETTCTVTLVPGTGITKVALTCRASYDGIDGEAFQEAAKAAKDGCPVSALFAGGSAEITLDATTA